jgi:hypothetical protein
MMPYAQGRTFYDADSHVMELGDWLPKYADAGIRERIRPLYLGGYPIRRFEATLTSIGADAKDRFYARNFADMMGF